jgi:hypothetical protein
MVWLLRWHSLRQMTFSPGAACTCCRLCLQVTNIVCEGFTVSGNEPGSWAVRWHSADLKWVFLRNQKLRHHVNSNLSWASLIQSTLSPRYIFVLSSHPRLRLAKMLHVFLISAERATCPVTPSSLAVQIMALLVCSVRCSAGLCALVTALPKAPARVQSEYWTTLNNNNNNHRSASLRCFDIFKYLDTFYT